VVLAVVCGASTPAAERGVFGVNRQVEVAQPCAKSSSIPEKGLFITPWGQLWYGRAGTGMQPPLLTRHGGPGGPHYACMRSIGALAEEQPVILYDQLGCGRSDRPTDPALWTAERLAEARVVLETSGRGDPLAETYRLQGVLLLQHAVPDATQAEICFQRALTIARRQQAKSWELRAAMSLSQLWQRQGQRDAARDLLAPIYGWFTEGFETVDLREAKALLEEFS
jgi:hypothetical protein